MKKNKIIIALLLTTTFLSANTDENIQKCLQNLDKNFFACKSKNIENSSKKELDCKIKDAKGFIRNFTHFFDEISQEANINSDFYKYLHALHFKGTIENQNNTTKANLYVNKIENNISKEDTFSFEKLVDKKLIDFDINFDEKNIVKNIVFKDVNEKFTDKNESANVKILGLNITNNSKKDELIAILSLDKIYLETYLNKSKQSIMDLDKVIYNVNYKSAYNYDDELKYDDFAIDVTDEIFLHVKKTDMKSFTISKKDKINLSYTVDSGVDLKDYDRNMQFKIQNLHVTFDLQEVNLQAYKKLNTLMYSKNDDNLSEKLLDDQYIKVINQGFKLNTNVSMNNVQFLDKNFGQINLQLSLKFAPNNINSFADAVSIMDINAKFSMDKKSFEALKEISPADFIEDANKYALVKGSMVEADITLKDGNLTVNGKEFE